MSPSHSIHNQDQDCQCSQVRYISVIVLVEYTNIQGTSERWGQYPSSNPEYNADKKAIAKERPRNREQEVWPLPYNELLGHNHLFNDLMQKWAQALNCHVVIFQTSFNPIPYNEERVSTVCSLCQFPKEAVWVNTDNKMEGNTHTSHNILHKNGKAKSARW